MNRILLPLRINSTSNKQCCSSSTSQCLQAAQFARTEDYVSAKHTTAASGIGSMLHKAEIDDFVFEPCGYSMNGCDGDGFSTIHVTPEEGFSYASLELTGYPAKGVEPTAIVTKVCLALMARNLDLLEKCSLAENLLMPC